MNRNERKVCIATSNVGDLRVGGGERWSTASTTREIDCEGRPRARRGGVARVGVVGAAWRFESEKRSQLARRSA